MKAITQVYTGSDLVIPQDVLAQLGLKPGDRVAVQPVASFLLTAGLSPEEQARINQVLDNLWGAWSEEDELAFAAARQEIWQSWLPRS